MELGARELAGKKKSARGKVEFVGRLCKLCREDKETVVETSSVEEEKECRVARRVRRRRKTWSLARLCLGRRR